MSAVYERLFDQYGPQEWWPARTPFEMMVGAVLVQNTAWRNVAESIDALLRALLLSIRGVGPETTDVICLYATRRPDWRCRVSSSRRTCRSMSTKSFMR